MPDNPISSLKELNASSWESRQKDSAKRYQFKNRYKIAYDRLLFHKPRSWLDIGTGNGYLASLARNKLAKTTITGIDFVKEILYQARDINNRLVVNIDRGYLPFSDGSFDYITCMDVLEHLVLPQNCQAELHRVLKPGGRCLFSVPNMQFIEHVLALIKGKVPPPASDLRHMSIYTINHLKNELSLAGLMVNYIAGCDASPEWLSNISIKYLCKTIVLEFNKV